jgi:hypothetical protein
MFIGARREIKGKNLEAVKMGTGVGIQLSDSPVGFYIMFDKPEDCDALAAAALKAKELFGE